MRERVGVLIVGGGIAGLATALGLHARGVDCLVAESVREIVPLGVGINLLPHGVRVLTELGLAPALADVAIETRAIEYRASDGRLMWQTPLARELLKTYYGTSAPETPAPILDWLRRHLKEAEAQIEPPRLTVELGARRLTFRLHQQTGDDDWLIVMREVSDAAIIESMSLAFKLTAKEAEVLYWVVKGKINRDIADIVGSSPATVKKHLERVFAKLGVETRTAAAGMAMNRIRQLHPQFEG